MRLDIEKLFPEEDVRLFKNIEYLMFHTPNPWLSVGQRHEKIELTSHLLCRAISEVLSVSYECRYVDGFFCRKHKHTWLVTKNDNIIDVMPRNILGGPIMLLANSICGEDQPYKQLKNRESISKSKIFSEPWFVEAVEILAGVFRDQMNLGRG